MCIRDRQCSELYPEKPIYDIPSRPHILAQELTDDLMRQAKTFHPIFHLNQQVEKIEKSSDQLWKLTTSTGNVISAKCIVIAAGAGSFVPRKPPIENIDKFENKNVFFSIKDKSKFKDKKILIAGGGDSALDWTNELASSAEVTLIHRRKEFPDPRPWPGPSLPAYAFPRSVRTGGIRRNPSGRRGTV